MSIVRLTKIKQSFYLRLPTAALQLEVLLRPVTDGSFPVDSGKTVLVTCCPSVDCNSERRSNEMPPKTKTQLRDELEQAKRELAEVQAKTQAEVKAAREKLQETERRLKRELEESANAPWSRRGSWTKQ